jgi:hypothetical protein
MARNSFSSLDEAAFGAALDAKPRRRMAEAHFSAISIDCAFGGPFRALPLHLKRYRVTRTFSMTRVRAFLTNLVVIPMLLIACSPLLAGSGGRLALDRFLTARDFNVGNGPDGIAAADLNKDGKLDVVVTNPGDSVTNGHVSVILGTGDGRFNPPMHWEVGLFPVAVAVADLNGDGNPDLIVLNGGPQSGFSPGSVSILLGNGHGVFQVVPQKLMVGIRPGALAIGDFNHDGNLDLAVANAGDSQGDDTRGVSILLGDGRGAFKPPVNYQTGGVPQSLAVADLNGDGKLDLAIANADENGSGSLSILPGNKNGTFSTAINIGPIGTSVAAGDIDGDGKPDLVEAGQNGGVNVFLNDRVDRTFHFQPPVNYQTPSLGSVLLGDFNADGKLDIAAVVNNNILTVLLNDGRGKFPNARGYIVGSGGAAFAAAGDFNGDGIPDLAVTNYGFGGDNCEAQNMRVQCSTVSILLNNGDGTFRAGYAFDAASFSSVVAVAVGDFDEDGSLDLVLVNQGSFGTGCQPPRCDSVSVLLNTGDGTFLPAVGYPAGLDPSDVKVTDFDGDGHLDLVVSNTDSSTVSILKGNGNGSFQLPQPIPVGAGPTSVVVADFNNDGNPDVAVTTELDNSVSILLGRGDGTFPTEKTIPNVGDTPVFLIDGTFRHSAGNDRHSRGNDLAVANCGINCAGKPNNSSISILEENGAGSFVLKENFKLGLIPNSIAVGDFNHDGFLDLAVSHFGDLDSGGKDPGGISILLGRGDGTFGPSVDFVAGVFPSSVVAADFSGRRNLDLVASTGLGPISLLVGNGDGTFRQPLEFNVGIVSDCGSQVGCHRIVMGDFNHDGTLDLAVATFTGVTVLLNTGGTSVVASASDTQPPFGKPVTLTAALRPSLKGTGIPSGTVTFQDDSAFPVATLGTAKLVAGKATLSASNLSVGTHLIRANYGGDANFNPHSSPELKLLVAGDGRVGGSAGGGGGNGGGKCSAPPAHTQSVDDMRPIRFVGTSRVEKGQASGLHTAPLDVHARISMKLELHKPRLSRPARGDVALLATATQPIGGRDRAFFGFNGLDHEDSLNADHGNQSSVEPPDQALAVSSTQVLEAVNDVVAVYSKNGGLLAGPISLNTFFKLAPAKLHGQQVYGPFVTDPRALYDGDTRRWFVSALMIETDSSTGDFLPHSEVLLAVSDTNDATGSFTQYAIDVTDSDSADCPCVGDQPLLGINKDGVYITTDQFAFSDFSFKTVLVLAMDKFSLAQGTLIHAVSLKTLQQDEVPGFAIQPAITLNRHDAAANNGTEFLMNSLDFSGTADNQLSVWALMNTASLRGSQPHLRILKSEVDTETYSTPPPVGQKEGHTPLRDTLNASGGKEKLEMLETDDDRLQQLYMAGGKLFTALTTKVTGTAGTTHSAIAWFVLNPEANACSVTATVSEQGYVAANNADVMFPAVAVNRKGSGVIAFSLAGPNNFPSSGYVRLGRRGVIRGIHVDSVGAGPEDGFSGYLAFGGNGTARWGDYSAAAVGQEGDLWFASEYIPDQPRTPLANWGTFIGKVGEH